MSEYLKIRAAQMREEFDAVASERGWPTEEVEQAHAAIDALDFHALDRVLSRLDR